MKLNINKACDLSSISVFPPHSRRPNPISSGVDSSGSGKIQPSQLRSQSQQPFSQGTSRSQLSQGSLDEVLTNEQRFGSREKDYSAKWLSRVAPIASSRAESQMQLSKSSNNVWRTTSSSASAQRCHVSEELEHRIGLVESSLNRLGRILDTIQSDVMQVNKAVKEVLLEMEGLPQKFIIQDNHMQLMLKEEENIKANLSGILKSTLDQLRKEFKSADQQKLHIISAAISSLPARIEARLLNLQNEICGIFTKKTEVPVQKADAKCKKLLKTESFPLRTVKQTIEPKKEEMAFTVKASDFSLIIESDEENDGGFSHFFEKKEAGSKSCFSKEARAESMRILKKARRKRKLTSTIVLE